MTESPSSEESSSPSPPPCLPPARAARQARCTAAHACAVVQPAARYGRISAVKACAARTLRSSSAAPHVIPPNLWRMSECSADPSSSAAAGPAVLGVVLAALISPVPLLTVTYAVEYGCDVGLGAAAVNAANFCSFALLLVVANADLSSPATARAFATAGAALAALGAFGARRGGAAAGKRGGAPEDTETAVEAMDVTTESREREGDGGNVLRAIARSSSVSRVSRTRPVRGAGFGWPAAPKKCVSPRVAAAPPRASVGLPGRSGTHEGRRAGGFHEPSRRFSAIAGSRARAVVGARFG